MEKAIFSFWCVCKNLSGQMLLPRLWRASWGSLSGLAALKVCEILSRHIAASLRATVHLGMKTTDVRIGKY